MTKRIVLCLVIAFFGMFLFCSCDAQVKEQVFVLEEHLDRTWKDQMLTYDFSATRGRCHPDSLVLEGPDGFMPVQLSEVELWPEQPHVRNAKVSFFVKELPPLSKQKYVLRYLPVPLPELVAPPVPTSLSVKQETDKVEIVTDRIGLRLLMGRREFDPPLAPEQVPAPMQELRMLDGSWIGAGSLYGPVPVKSYEAILTAAGPVFAMVETVYRFTDDSTVTYRFRLAGGDSAVEIDAESSADQTDAGWELELGGKALPLKKAVLVAHRNHMTREIEVVLEPDESAFAELSPWAGWWWGRFPTMLRLDSGTEAGQILLSSRDAGVWVEPLPLEERSCFPSWGKWRMGWVWGRMHLARLPLFAGENGNVTIKCNNRRGTRHFTLAVAADGTGQLETFTGGNQTSHTPNPRLDQVKNMVLEWPDGKPENPHLFLNATELQDAAERCPDSWKRLQNLEGFVADISALGRIDMMRRPMDIVGRYDALINSDNITPEQRKLYRAQTAYLLYRLASPLTWSVERGYVSGNPNMTVSFAVNAGMLALTMRDNPYSETVIAETVRKVDFWLDKITDDQGYWLESAHYARVSWNKIMFFGIAATKAGVRDYLGDPKFQKMAEFYEKTLTPGDPTRPMMVNPEPGSFEAAPRVAPPYGRGERFDVWGFSGPLAQAFSERFPELSRKMQWSWERTGYNAFRGHMPAGLSQLYSDKTLPSENPGWSSEFFTHLGFLLRQHLGTDDESYLLLSSRMARNPDGEIWPAHVGGLLKWFAYGMPVATSFPMGGDDHVAMINRVSLAGNWDPQAGENPDNRYHTHTLAEVGAFLPALDYVRIHLLVNDTQAYGHDLRMPKTMPALPKREQAGQAPMDWQRQLLKVDTPEPGGVQYLVLRDSVLNEQPTQWHFWTLTELLDTPEAVQDRAAALERAPGHKTVELRELSGPRFTGIGQFGVDLEYYIATPANTPRYTLRTTAGVSGAYGAVRPKPIFQDLLHLQLSGQGAYYVVLFARRAESATPEFRTLADGNIIQISGDFGTDLAFLACTATDAETGKARFAGTAAQIQDRKAGGITLNLCSAGAVYYGEWGIESEHPVQLHAAADAVRISVPETFPGGTVLVHAPGTKAPKRTPRNVRVDKHEQGWLLTLPAGTNEMVLSR